MLDPRIKNRMSDVSRNKKLLAVYLMMRFGNFSKTIAVAMMILAVSPAIYADWQQVGIVSLAIDSGNTPYLAYSDAANSNKASIITMNVGRSLLTAGKNK